MRHDPELIRAAAALVPRHNRQATQEAFFSLSQTQRRLAHRYRREALEWELRGNMINYHDCRTESDRLWRSAKWSLQMARR